MIGGLRSPVWNRSDRLWNCSDRRRSRLHHVPTPRPNQQPRSVLMVIGSSHVLRKPKDADEAPKLIVVRCAFSPVDEAANDLKIADFIVTGAIDPIEGVAHLVVISLGKLHREVRSRA